MLSLSSIDTRVGLTWRLSSLAPLNFDRVQNFAGLASEKWRVPNEL